MKPEDAIITAINKYLEDMKERNDLQKLKIALVYVEALSDSRPADADSKTE